ncbi:hypothetical protein BT69DRAFT_1262060 [Atractiella rhizophila]|nr:hypothetical protein BT69DRAFT_1262060 [Atractiella rhizophila]
MGRWALEERVEWKREEEGEKAGELGVEDVRQAMADVVEVKYGQPIHVGGGKGKPPVTLVALPSGHTLGGSIFAIRSPAEPSPSSSVVYAPFLNHIKERLLDSSGLVVNGWIPENVRRCGVLVTAAERGMIHNMRRKDRDRLFVEAIDHTLQSYHSVLIPTDPSARLLEILTLLEQHWTYRYSSAHAVPPLCLVTKTGKDVLTFIRSLTAWMGGLVVSHSGVSQATKEGEMEGGEEGSDSVLRFKNLKHFSSLEALRAAIPDTTPKCVLTVSTDISYGPSRNFLADTPFASISGNLLLFPSLPSPSTLGREIFDYWNSAQGGKNRWGGGRAGKEVDAQLNLPVEIGRKKILEGEELRAFMDAKEREREKGEKDRAREERKRKILEAEDDDESEEEDEDEDDEEGGKEEVADRMIVDEEEETKEKNFDIYIRPDRKKRVNLLREAMKLYISGNIQAAEQLQSLAYQKFRMFPLISTKRKVDSYGETVDVEEWMRRGKEEEVRGAEEKEREDAMSGKRVKKSEEKEQEKGEPPHKFIKEEKKVEMRCSILAVDMEGKTDGPALKAIIPQINPKQLVLIHGDSSSLTELGESVRSSPAMSGEIFVPREGEEIGVGEKMDSLNIRLSDTLLNGIKLSKQINDDYEIAHLTGQITHSDSSSVPVLSRLSFNPTTANGSDASTSLFHKLLASSTQEQGDGGAIYPDPDDPTIKILPPLNRTTHFIGDMKLAELKNRLAERRIHAEFAGGGTLVCGGSKGAAEVAVMKGQGGEVLIEGAVGETYFTVRSEVYKLHARAG